MKIKDNLVKILVPVLAILVAFAAGGIIMLCIRLSVFRRVRKHKEDRSDPCDCLSSDFYRSCGVLCL